MDSLYGGSVPASKIDNLLNSALKTRAKELNRCIKPCFRRPLNSIYRFHQSVNNARSITILKLEGIRLKTIRGKLVYVASTVNTISGKLVYVHV